MERNEGFRAEFIAWMAQGGRRRLHHVPQVGPVDLVQPVYPRP